MHKTALALGLFALTSVVCGGEFTARDIVISVPSGFEGPVSAQPAAQVKTYAYTVAAATSSAPLTVLQISVYDAMADPPSKHAGKSPLEQLLQMLAGIERRRTEFRKSAPRKIQLAGFSAAMVSWQGKAGGIATNGMLFCVATKSQTVFYHVMGGGDAPNARMLAAIEAVEKARRN